MCVDLRQETKIFLRKLEEINMIDTSNIKFPAWQLDAKTPDEYHCCEMRRGREFLVRMMTGADPSLAIARFAKENRQVISCGGGVVKDPANLRALHANGIVLFIDRPLEDLLVGGGRPLSTSPEALKTMEAQRRPLYLAAADAVIPNKTTPADAVTAAMEALDEIFSH